MSCAKTLLVFFNTIFLLCGGALIGLGIWGLVDNNNWVTFFGKYVTVVGWTAVGLGIGILIVSFFGCYGAIKESTCMLGFYIFCMVVLLMLEIACAVLAYVYRNKIQDEISNQFFGIIDDPSGNLAPVNNLQTQFQCCGYNNYTDYYSSAFPIPTSCCQNPSVVGCNNTVSNLWPNGCGAQLYNSIKKNIIVIAAVATAVAVFQIILIIAACSVRRSVKMGFYA